MPISDKVIELETKKKGRTAIFIVFIALLAAASVAFAVLWIVKAPATDPPAVEKIEMSTHDLYQSGKDPSTSEPIYEVSPGCNYTMNFDLVLKSNSDETNTNGLVNVSTEPAGCIEYKGELVKVDIDKTENEAGETTEGNKYYRYRLNFTVKDSATQSFRLVVKSQFSPSAAALVDFTVSENSHTEYFDLVAKDGNYVVYENGAPSKTTLLAADKDKSTDTLKYYKNKADLIYYTESAGTRKNVAYRLDFEQLGKLSGVNDLRAKVYAGKNGEQFDEVKVEAGIGDDYESAVYTTITDQQYQNTRLKFDIASGEKYYKSALLFTAKEAGVNFIKLTANVNNSATPLVIVLEVNFQSSDEIDKITEIVFIDPYTGEPSGTKDSATVNLFMTNDVSNFLTVSDWIKVRRGSKELKDADWNEGGLSGYISKNDDKLFGSDPTYVQGFKLTLQKLNQTGSCVVTIRDTDEKGFAAVKDITVNLLSPIDDLSVNTGEKPKEVIIPTSSSRTEKIAATLTLHGNTKFEDVKDSLYSVYKLTLPENFEYNKSGLISAKGATDKEKKTFSIEGLDAKEGIVTVKPSATQVATTAAAVFEIKVGDDIETGSYTFGFELMPQGLDKSDDGVYGAIPTLKFTITLDVTHLADSLGATREFTNGLDSADRYTEIEIDNVNHRATLTIGVGTGKNGKTSFKVSDFLAYYDKDGVKMDKTSDIKVNGDALTVSGDTSALDSTENIGDKCFTVPSAHAQNKTLTFALATEGGVVKDHTGKDIVFTLTVEYKMPVTQITVYETEKERVVEYKLPPQDKGLLLNNGADPNPDVTPSIDENGVLIGGDGMKVFSGTTNIVDKTMLKHPELLNFDIAVIRGSTARILLPKKRVEKSVYYFKPNANTDGITTKEQARAQAVFMVGYENPLDNYNVTVLKDLFELSFIANQATIGGKDNPDYYPQLDYQKLAFLFSYGKVQNSDSQIKEDFEEDDDKAPEISSAVQPFVITLNERGIIQTVDSQLVAITYWNLIRRLDGIKIYSNENYNTEIDATTEEKALWYLNDQSFKIYHSGIITFAGLNSREFVVERDNELLNLNCVAIETTIGIDGETTDTYITKDFNGRFVATCSQGDRKNGAYISCKAHGVEFPVKVYVSVSNQAIPIEKIEFFLDNPETNPQATAVGNNSVFWMINGIYTQGTVYFRITWKPYNGQDSRFEGMTLDLSALETAGFDVGDVKQPTTYDVDPADRNLTEGKQHVYYGYINIKLKDNVENGDYVFSATRDTEKTPTASGTLHITTLINHDMFGVIPDDNKAEKVHAVHDDATETVKTFTYVYKNNSGANVHTFAFDFGDVKVDKKNLTYKATVISGIDGKFYAENSGEYANGGGSFTFDAQPNILGYRLYLRGNTRIANTRLEITIIEKYTIYERSAENGSTGAFVERTNTYTIRFYVEVFPYVETLDITVSEKDGAALTPDTTNSAPAYNFTTDGRKDSNEQDIKKAYDLSALVNGVVWNTGDSTAQLKLPQNSTPTFALTGGGNVFTLGTDNLTLYVNTSKVSPETATLTVTVDGKTATVALNAQTARRSIRFASSDWSTKQTYTTNPTLDFRAYVYDAGDTTNPPKDLNFTPTYTVNYIEQNASGFTVKSESDLSSHRFEISGISGKFTITARYTYMLGGVSETISVTSEVITVEVPLAGINIKKGNALVSSTVNLTAGQTVDNTFTAEAYYAVDALNTEANLIKKGFNVSSANGSIASVSIDDSGVITVTPISAGNTTVTVSYTVGGQTISSSFTVNVQAKPALNIALDVTMLDVFENGVLGFSVNGETGYTYSDIDVSIDGNGVFTAPTANGENRYCVTLSKSKETEIATALENATKFTVSASAKVTSLGTNYEVTAQEQFTLTAVGYVPTLSVSRTNGSVTNNELEKSNITEYSFSVNTPDYYTSAFKFTSEQLEFSDDTANPAQVSVSALKENISNTGSVNVTVTVLGKSYTADMQVAFTDNSTFASTMYYSTEKPFNSSASEIINSDGSVKVHTNENDGYKLHSVTEGDKIAMDFALEFSATYITVITDYSATPAAMHALTDKTKFRTDISGGLTLADAQLVRNRGGKYYHVAVFRVDTIGRKSVTVYTDAIGGSSYRAVEVHADFDATAPVFKLYNKVNDVENEITVPQITLTPGGNYVFKLNQIQNKFAGNVTYKWTLGGSTNGVVSGSTTDNTDTYTVSAIGSGEALKDGANALVTLTATVNTGVYAGTVQTFTVAVHVDKYAMPTVTKTGPDYVWIVEQHGTFDLKTLFAETHDSRDTDFAYTLAFTTGNNNAAVSEIDSNNVYNASGTTNIELNYTATLTAGLLKNSTGTQTLASGKVKIIVAPVMTWSGAETSFTISQGGTVNLGVKAPDGINLQVEKHPTTVEYRLSNAHAGTISNGVFTPAANFVGSVTVYAVATVGYGDGVGKTPEISKTITVTALAEPRLIVTKPNILGMGAYTLSSSVTLNDVSFDFNPEIGGNLITITLGANNTYTVTLKPNTMGGNVVIKATMTVGNDCTYAGGIYNGRVYEELISFTVGSSFTAPDKNNFVHNCDYTNQTVTASFTQDGYTPTIEYSVKGSGIKFTDIEGGKKYELVQTTQSQTAQIIVTVTLSAANSANPYNGTQFVWTSNEIKVEALPEKPEKPEIMSADVTLTVGDNFTATLGLTTTAQSKFKLLTCELSEQNTIDGVTVSNGIIKFSKDVVSSDKEIMLKVYGMIINNEDYAGELVTADIEVTLPAFPSGYGANGETAGEITLDNTGVFTYSKTLVCDDDTLINVSTEAADKYTYTFKKGAADKKFTFVITATVKSGVYANYTVELAPIVVTAPAEPGLTVNEESKTITVSNCTILTASSSNTNLVTVKVNGDNTVTYSLVENATVTEDTEVTVTVTAKAESGLYIGETYTYEYKITVLKNTTEQGGGDSGNQGGETL